VALAEVRALWVSALLAVVTEPAVQVGTPELGGVRLGRSPSDVRAVLGQPDRTQESIGMRFWDYARRGITLIWREGNPGVQGIVASRAAAGEIRGVRVGDGEALLRRQWGTPARARQRGRFLDFFGAHWVLSVELHDGTIVQMTLMGTADVSR
jgi:hypothetical protein